MRRRKKDNSIELLKWMIAVTILIIVIIIIIYILYYGREKQLEKELLKNGYTTSEEEAFYNKVVTNNTLDDYYNDIAAGRNSSYEEYYISKESNNFIELKMSYQNEINTTLNITSELNTGKINFNYELSYKESHIVLEGNSTDNYSCNVVVQKNAKQETLDYYCELVKDEINNFILKRQELLQNENISKRIK